MNNTNQNNIETREIVIKLDHYDDIFSDFDMRSYDKRALSSDLLDELKRAAIGKDDEGIEMIFNVPKSERHEDNENIIRERLKAHFARHFDSLMKDKRKLLKGGIIMIILGVISMIAATLVLSKHSDALWSSFLIIFLEPAAWFLLWEGADQLLFNSKNINQELDFYRKMADSRGHIDFRSY
jgi:hypothetical protein